MEASKWAQAHSSAAKNNQQHQGITRAQQKMLTNGSVNTKIATFAKTRS
jgi:hypothetical protein